MDYSQNILVEKVSFQGNAWSPIERELSIDEALRIIKEEKLVKEIGILREYLSSGDKEKYNVHKLRLPSVCFCATFDQTRRKSNLKKYNFLCVFDIDKLNEKEMDRLKTCFIADKYVYTFWESPSGNGLKGLVAFRYEFDISQYDLSELHKIAFGKLVQYFSKNYAVILDVSGSDITRLCFLSCDSRLHLKSNLEYFSILGTDFPKNDVITQDKVKSEKQSFSKIFISRDCLLNPEGKNNPKDRSRVRSVIKYLSKRKKSITRGYDNWFRVALVIANTFTHDIGEKYYLDLCRLDGSAHDELGSKNMLKYCYVNTRGRIKFNTLLHYAKLQGYGLKGDGSSEDGKNQVVSDDVVSISCSSDLVTKNS